jgi:MraZ protein
MFRGSYSARVDEKGRIKVPVDFKREIDDKYKSGSFYITSRSNGTSAEIFPMKEWEAIEETLAKKPATDPDIIKFFDHTSFWGQVVEMDLQGRLLLPGPLRNRAQLEGEVMVSGRPKSLIVRNKAAWAQEIEQKPYTEADAKALSALGI